MLLIVSRKSVSYIRQRFFLHVQLSLVSHPQTGCFSLRNSRKTVPRALGQELCTVLLKQYFQKQVESNSFTVTYDVTVNVWAISQLD
jgi:hypothetical protein